MISYMRGDATKPQTANGQHNLIVHVCNDQGGWGRGFVKAISARWPEPEREYRFWHKNGWSEDNLAFALGNIQLVRVESDIYVVNMIAQAGYRRASAPTPFSCEALDRCLEKVGPIARNMNAMIHMPRIGTGLGGASWNQVEPLLVQRLSGLAVVVYDL